MHRQPQGSSQRKQEDVQRQCGREHSHEKKSGMDADLNMVAVIITQLIL